MNAITGVSEGPIFFTSFTESVQIVGFADKVGALVTVGFKKEARFAEDAVRSCVELAVFICCVYSDCEKKGEKEENLHEFIFRL